MSISASLRTPRMGGRDGTFRLAGEKRERKQNYSVKSNNVDTHPPPFHSITPPFPSLSLPVTMTQWKCVTVRCRTLQSWSLQTQKEKVFKKCTCRGMHTRRSIRDYTPKPSISDLQIMFSPHPFTSCLKQVSSKPYNSLYTILAPHSQT